MNDIGATTHSLRTSAQEICDAWMETPYRRPEFGAHEVQDIREAVLGLWTILREIEAVSDRSAA